MSYRLRPPRAGVALVSLLALLGILACGGGSTDTGSSVVTSTPTTPAAHNYKVGQVVNVGGEWDVTVNGAKQVPGNDLFTPTAGNVFVAIDVTLKNASSSSANLSPLTDWTLRDASGVQASNSDMIDLDAYQPPEGTINQGGQARGYLVYQVVSKSGAYTLAFSPDLGTSNTATWDITLP